MSESGSRHEASTNNDDHTGAGLRIAAFGFRSYPPSAGGAGADKFASELLPRLARRGHSVTAYNRVYPGIVHEPGEIEVDGVKVISLRTIQRKGFDTLLHSAKVTYDIIRHDRADIVHIQNGGNSPFGAILRVFGKRTFLSQDGLDWERDKWPWYAKIYLYLSSFITAHVHSAVIFDNIFARKAFASRFNKNFDFIPFGADVADFDGSGDADVLKRFGLETGRYFLFVGRFIPDKGLHWLIPAFEAVSTDFKLMLVGGSPNPSPYESEVRHTADNRVVFPGFLYGRDVHTLMRNAYAYVQPSSIEGLSPVILEAAFLGAPILCSDIPQNRYAMSSNAIFFEVGDVKALSDKLEAALRDSTELRLKAEAGRLYVAEHFSWDSVVAQHEEIFRR